MLGIVFSEFTQMVEDKFSMDTLDDILDASQNPHDGSYTAVGVYEHKELIDLVVALSEKTGVPADDLVQAFGEHMLARFNELYPMFFQDQDDMFKFLEGIEKRIHSEVRKLYPSAELPMIDWECPEPNIMQLHYKSGRPFAALALGLAKGCIAHFNESCEITMEGSPTDAIITLKRVPR
ncbi:MAG: heme NO-binding domain-containing protein [Magnetococcales bacterium]|nr:heme NO-binding domain-containing protein [Magnetococcales bacterium]